MTPDRARLEAIKKDAYRHIAPARILWLVERLEEALEVMESSAESPTTDQARFLSRFEDKP